ncbi:MAG: hypothetical protein D6693_09700 [Planctomycetota bacterium]|nr:MAG: hypothetical protein D6693_09700 [Planctomycetota bacterium]
MFDQIKSVGAVAGLMRDKERLRRAADTLTRRLAEVRATGDAGVGAVRVTAAGDMTIVSVELSPALAASIVDEESRAACERLIAEAANEALRRARALAQGEVTRLAREMGLPDLPGLGGLLPGV